MSAVDLTLRAPTARRLRVPRVGVVLAGVVVVVAVLAVVSPGLLTSADPNLPDPLNALRPPGGAHWFGTDQLGRDVYARVVYGARPALAVGVGATALAVVLGTLLGVLAGIGGRFVDEVLMRAVDVLLAFPSLLLALLVIAVVGPGPGQALAAIGVASAPAFARLVRVQVQTVLRSPYVEAAVAIGQRRSRLVVRHVVPNAFGPLLAMATIGVGTSIIAGSSLSFLGLGPKQPSPEWGAMLAAGRSFFQAAWWMSVFPGAAVTVAVIAVTTLGRAARGRLEGRSQP